MGILVDTCFFIDLERGKKPDYMDLPPNEDFLISAITLSELLLGLHFAKTPIIAQKRKAFIDHLCTQVTVLDFTEEIARLHAKYGADLLTRKIPIGRHDLIIAATALYYQYPVLTRNAREFSRIKDLQVLEYFIPPANPTKK